MALMAKSIALSDEDRLLLEVAMANMGHTIMIKYCTDVIWHGLHGGQIFTSHGGVSSYFLVLTHTVTHCLSVSHTD